MTIRMIAATVLFGLPFATAAFAECSGGNGRGWSGGKGAGAFEMAAGDKTCLIGFPNFIDDAKNTRIPATEVTLKTAPKSGKIGVTAKGLVYTPNPGFKGKDRFCTQNASPEVKGQTLSGCITVTVR